MAALTAGVGELRPLFVAVSLGLTAATAFLASSRNLTLREVLFLAVVFRLLFLPLLPSLSDDAYRYLWDGMLPWHGFNPFLHTPGDPILEPLQSHPVFNSLNSEGYYTVYPPVSQILFGLWGWIPGSWWPLAYILTKLTVVGLEFVALLMLGRMVAPRMLALYAWSPLVVTETAGQLHTEALLVFFLLAGVFFYRRGNPGWSVAAMTCAVYVKLYPIFLLPFLLRRVGWKWVGVAAAVSAAAVAPYYDAESVPRLASSLELYVGYFEFYSGPYLVLKELAYRSTVFDDVEATIGVAMMLAYACYVGWLFWMDRRASRTLADAAFLLLAGWYCASTTVHPWYFVGLLAVLPLVSMRASPWIWLSGFSFGTYLLYTHDVYWPFVWIGWGGWLGLAAFTSKSVRNQFRLQLKRIVRSRGALKAQIIRPYLRYEAEELDRPLAVLDLGAGEGFVGEALESGEHYTVTLCDIQNFNETTLPHVAYDGRTLPFGDEWFDATVIVFTLHHCEDHIAVLREAARVTSGRIVILESVFESEIGRRMLDIMDRSANWLRLSGQMADYRHFRRTADWVELLETMGFTIESVRTWGQIHHQALIVVESSNSIHRNSR